jgi:hypothetical protein
LSMAMRTVLMLGSLHFHLTHPVPALSSNIIVQFIPPFANFSVLASPYYSPILPRSPTRLYRRITFPRSPEPNKLKITTSVNPNSKAKTAQQQLKSSPMVSERISASWIQIRMVKGRINSMHRLQDYTGSGSYGAIVNVCDNHFWPKCGVREAVLGVQPYRSSTSLNTSTVLVIPNPRVWNNRIEGALLVDIRAMRCEGGIGRCVTA